jgi:hypothetical protein
MDKSAAAGKARCSSYQTEVEERLTPGGFGH